MQENVRKLLVSAIILFGLGLLVFFVTEQIQVNVEFMPLSFMLIMALVAGALLFAAGFLSYALDKLQ